MKSKYIIFCFVILLSSCFNERTFVHDYNYKTIIDEQSDKYDYNHFNEKLFEGLCEMEYGFLKYPWLIKAYSIDGALVARCGPPFTFFIRFNGINLDIENIKFVSFEFDTKSKIVNLLDMQDICSETSIIYSGNIREPNYDNKSNNWFWERDDLQTLERLRNENSINVLSLRSKGNEYFKEWVEKSECEYNEEEIKLLHEEKRFNFKVEIKNVPLNVDVDDDITISVSILFTSSDGKIKNVKFKDVYFKEYSEHYYSSPHPFLPKKYSIELLPEEKDIKL